MLEKVRRDSERYRRLGGWYTNAGFWIGLTYRLGAWAREQPAPLRVFFGALARIIGIPWRWLFNVGLPSSAKIGGGLCLIHPRNILVSHQIEIGEDCLIFHEVTLGTGPVPGTPRIGDRVDLFVGARILGGVTIGNDVQVGANCVVTRDVPDGGVVMTAAPRIIPRELIERLPNGRDARRARAMEEDRSEDPA